MRKTFVLAGLVAISIVATPAQAVPTITAAGSGLGFSITTVVSGLPGGSGVGVLGSTVTPTGQILLNDGASGTNYLFANADNQSPANAISSTGGQGFPESLVTANGAVWGSGGHLSRLNND